MDTALKLEEGQDSIMRKLWGQMELFYINSLIHKIDNRNSLRTHISRAAYPTLANSGYSILSGKLNSFFKKMMFCRRVPFAPKEKRNGIGGSMTVEASFAVPLFIFCMINLLYGIQVIETSSRITAALHETGNELCSYGYAYENAIGGIPAGVGSLVYASSSIAQNLRGATACKTGIKGGISGLTYLGSSVMAEGGIVKLSVTYSLKYPVNMSIRSYRLGTSYYGHAWVGYDYSSGISDLSDEDPVVYITPTGSVYHIDIDCSHLNPSTTSVNRNSVETLRSKDGSKYYACEICGSGSGIGNVYITDYGDRYHSNLYCSGIKRNIQAIHLSEVGGRRACMTCGG